MIMKWLEMLLNPAVLIPSVIVLVLILLLAIGYRKAPPDTAYIISGLRKKQKVLIGRAGIKIPFLERMDTISLKLISIDVKTSRPVPTADYINILVDSTVNVKVSNQPDQLRKAAENFLNQNSQYIANVAREVLEGNVREIIGKMKLAEMVNDRQKFAEMVKENAVPDLMAMGLDVISFNVQNFSDENGVINDLGIDNISQIKKNAAIAKAIAEKEISIEQSKADTEANNARVASQTEIARKNNELAIHQAELKRQSDIKKAEADAAYKIQQEEQRKTIEATTVMANIARQEKEVELRRKEAEVREQMLDAEVKKQAEAERFARQQKADAELYERQRKAEAEKFEKEKEAEAQKIQADAEKYQKEQEAAAIAALGQAEAEAIRAKGQAEAEAMEKKAEAYQKYTGAAMVEMLVQILPEMAGKVAEPLSKIDKITIFGGANGEDGTVSPVAGNVPQVMAATFQTIKEATGIDMAEIVKANTYDAKVNRNIHVTGLDEENGQILDAVVADELGK